MRHEKIIKARRDKNLRVSELGELAFIELKRIIDIEMGVVKPTGDELLAIAEALNTTIADILGLPVRTRSNIVSKTLSGQLDGLHKKYESDPPEGHLCERCQKRPCAKNEYGKMMWICIKCAEIKQPPLVNKARGTSHKGRHKRRTT